MRKDQTVGWALSFTLCWLASGAATSQAQSHTPGPNAIVKAESVPVYSSMRPSATVVKSLKKGDGVILDFEIRSATQVWCLVRLPGQTRWLGYVECEGVERVEQLALDGRSSAARPTPKRAGPGLPLAPPPARAATDYDEEEGLVVREGSIDSLRLAELEAQARSGSAAAMARAALAHLAAGRVELSRNDSNRAMQHYRAALRFAGKRPDLLLDSLLNLAYVHLRRSEYSTALEYLKRARPMAPQSAEVAGLAGWAYYGLNRMDQAVEEWKTAQRIQPTPAVAQWLERAEREKEAEREFREGETGHFVLRYHGGAAPQLALEILRTLEEHFRSLQSELRFTPAEPIGVVLYTQQTYQDITRAPDWSGAVNDGRIRLRVQGLGSVSSDLSHALKHELAHSFLHQRTIGRCPGWLHEGLAEWLTGRRSARFARALIAVHERGASVPFKLLEGSFGVLSEDAARYAYAWSLAAVESIIANSGMWGIERLLNNLATESSAEAALRSSLYTTYQDLEQETARYLRRTYLQ